jgi:murein DD-endopeptidase MepM/ murein hydrolase activator NlpD
MAEIYEARIAPFINEVFLETASQPYYSDGSIHGGLDLSTGANSPLYAMVTGTVLYSQYNIGGYGNCIIMQDDITGDTLLYGHLRDLPIVSVGGHVNVGDFIGWEGSTGQSTGNHVHLEIQYLTPGEAWHWGTNKLTRPHVADWMGIPNRRGIRAIYNGTPGPTPPKPEPFPPVTLNRTQFKWVLYSRKNRNRRNSQ